MADRVTMITKPKLLLGEGVEEVRFFGALLKHMAIEDIQVDEYGGKSRLPRALRTLTLRPGFEKLRALAITRDSDFPDNAELDAAGAEKAAFHSVCSAIDCAGLIKPGEVGRASAGAPAVSAFIMPGLQRLGMLEDLCVDSVSGKPEFECVLNYLTCIEETANRRQKRHNAAKAKVHAWLATLNEPDKRLGEAAEAGYWDFAHPAFDALKSFMRSL